MVLVNPTELIVNPPITSCDKIPKMCAITYHHTQHTDTLVHTLTHTPMCTLILPPDSAHRPPPPATPTPTHTLLCAL